VINFKYAGNKVKYQNYVHEEIKMKTSMQRWWKVTDRENLNALYSLYKCNMVWPMIEPQPPQ
jgi:hypothetical protein